MLCSYLPMCLSTRYTLSNTSHPLSCHVRHAIQLLPLTSSNFEAAIPVFYNYFYHEDIQGLLTQNAFFQKLWQYLLSTTATADSSSNAAAAEPAATTLYGHSLGPMHSTAATKYNILDVEGN